MTNEEYEEKKQINFARIVNAFGMIDFAYEVWKTTKNNSTFVKTFNETTVLIDLLYELCSEYETYGHSNFITEVYPIIHRGVKKRVRRYRRMAFEMKLLGHKEPDKETEEG